MAEWIQCQLSPEYRVSNMGTGKITYLFAPHTVGMHSTACQARTPNP